MELITLYLNFFLRLKLHEDWGTTPAAIDCALTAAEKHDVQVSQFSRSVLFHAIVVIKLPPATPWGGNGSRNVENACCLA